MHWGLIIEPIEERYEQDGVWPENEAALRAFLAVCTQFRVVAQVDRSLRYTGLDYSAADVGLRNAGVTVMPELWIAIQTIEAGVLAAHRDGGEA